MKALLLTAAAILLGGAASAQTVAPGAPVTRADAHFVLGWQNLKKEQPTDHYNDWLNGILYGGAGVGWYWTDNLKTQIDFGAGTRAQQYRTRQVPLDRSLAYESSRLSVSQQSLAVAQQYQFFRNQWFHPHVGVGVNIARETSTEDFQPVIVYDSPISRVIRPARTEGPEHRAVVRPFAETGFKAYMTRRVFFTGDMRLMFRAGIDEVLFRGGFGIDF